MRNEGIGSWTARRARKTPNKTAVIHNDQPMSYARLHERVTRLAHALRDLGVRGGDRVAFLGPNHPAFLEGLFATGMLGAIFVPLNTRLAGPELRHCVSDSGCAVLLHTAEYDEPGAELDDQVRHRIGFAASGGAHEYETLLAAASTEQIDEPVGLADPCLINYTSGTTGEPKGAVLSHGNITWNSLNVLVDIDLAADEVTLVVAPLFHTAGLNMTCLPTLLKGGTVVLVPTFRPAEVLELIGRHGVTYMFGVPTMYDAMARCPEWDTADLASLRQVNCGGAPVPATTIRTYQQRGLAFSQGYGMTEAAPGALYLTKEASTTKAGTAGVPHFFTDVQVVDTDGARITPGEKGEVLVSGPNVMTGYWGRPDATAHVLHDGWFRSGDVATVDEDGYVAIVDRVKDVIISGGENIYPAEVEFALHEHPSVVECAVIGVPDEQWGEVGRAFVVRAAVATVTAAELRGFLRGRLAKYKIPKHIEFVDELPRNPSGKILKKTLRERYRAQPAQEVE